MISRELLSLVHEKEVKDVKVTIDQPNMVVFNLKSYSGSMAYTNALNLDTLGRLCKEWCIKHGAIEIQSGIEDEINYICVLDFKGVFDVMYFRGADTELEAVIKATEWVAREKGLL